MGTNKSHFVIIGICHARSSEMKQWSIAITADLEIMVMFAFFVEATEAPKCQRSSLLHRLS